MTTLTIVQARSSLADSLNRVAYRGERIRISRRGKTVAALVPVEDLDALERMEDEADARAAKKALREYEKDPTTAMPYDEFRRRMGLAK